MTDHTPLDNEEHSGEQYYTETVVEYVDNRRQRALLGILLVLLFLLLLGASYAVYRLTPGTGAPVGQSASVGGLEWVRSIYGWGNQPNQLIQSPTDVAIGPDGTIWVVSSHRVVAGFDPDGRPKRVLEPTGTASIEGIAVSSDNKIFLADFGGQVLEMSPEGAIIDRWKVQLPNELDVRDGKLAVASAPGIAVFTVNDSKMLVQIGGARGWGKDQFDLPHGIVIGPDGSIFVSDTQNRRIKAFTPSGRLLWTLGTAPDRSKAGVADVRSQDSSVSASQFLIPSGMALDGKGRIVVVDPFRFNITVVDAKTGKVVRQPGKNGQQGKLAVYGEQGANDGQLNYPTGIAYDKTRDWFAVADTANNRVQIFRIPGSGGSVFAPLVGGFRWPMCVFCLPLLLLLLAIIMLAMRRRRAREIESTPEALTDVSAEE